MARAKAEKVGRGQCPMQGCGASVTYRKSVGGLLKWQCDDCDSSGFMDPNGTAYKKALSGITSQAEPGEVKGPSVLVTELPATAPAAPPRRAAFDLGAL